jgi:single-strand DNA-binding protein
MIKLQVIGHLGKDAVVNTVNGKTVINFNMAHSEKFKDAQGNPKERTTWVDCSYWTDRTAVAPYLKKGTQVYAEGTPDVRAYTAKDGTQGAALTMRVFSVQLLGSKTGDSSGEQTYSSGSSYQQPAAAGSHSGEITEPVDDLPF